MKQKFHIGGIILNTLQKVVLHDRTYWSNYSLTMLQIGIGIFIFALESLASMVIAILKIWWSCYHLIFRTELLYQDRQSLYWTKTLASPYNQTNFGNYHQHQAIPSVYLLSDGHLSRKIGNWENAFSKITCRMAYILLYVLVTFET